MHKVARQKYLEIKSVAHQLVVGVGNGFESQPSHRVITKYLNNGT